MEQSGREVQKSGLWNILWYRRRQKIAPSPCLGVSRRTIVQNCWLSSLRCKCMMGISRSDRDSEYVVRIATSRASGETQKGNEGNADLWEEFETVLRRNTTRRLGFVWVKGHATKVHIDRQITTSLHKGGNDAADALASAAAAQARRHDRSCHRQAAYCLGHAQFCC